MDFAEGIIQEIIKIARDMGLHLDVNYGASWAGSTEHCIGIPTKKQSKRKIWRGFFHVRPEEGTICLAAHDTTGDKLAEKYGFQFRAHPDAYVNPIPKNCEPLKLPLDQLDLDNPKHRDFIKEIIHARWLYCGGKKENQNLQDKPDLDEKVKNVRDRRGEMFGFISFVKKDGNYIGGYLGTDEELLPIEFSVTDSIKPPDKLQKILHGAQLDMKWFGDLIAGTLLQGVQETGSLVEKKMEAFIVSDERMLHLRRKTGDIPIAFITGDGAIDVHPDYPKDRELVGPIIEKIKKHSSVSEVLDRINKGIEEKILSTSQTGKQAS